MRFSIIIPAYNAQDHIHRSLLSCLKQSYQDLEILLIDDGSDDDTLQIAKRLLPLQSPSKQLRIFSNQANRGPFYSRILGCQKASGDYILFLDSDDYLAEHSCELLAKNLDQNPCDILHFRSHYDCPPSSLSSSYWLHKLRKWLPSRHQAGLHLQSGDMILQHYFLSSYHFPKMTLWDKAYSKNVILRACKLTLPKYGILYAEDIVFFFLIASQAQSLGTISDPLYHYCLNPSSTTQSRGKSPTKIQSLQALLALLSSFVPTSQTQRRAKQRLHAILRSQIALERRFEGDYLLSCLRSLKDWNRCLTYIRILAFLLTLGRLKL